MRYVIPLVETEYGTIRINKISDKANNKIIEYLNSPKGGYYTYFDFPFEPYQGKDVKKLVKKRQC